MRATKKRTLQIGSMLDSNKALIIFSGGQDSTTCLYWAIRKFSANTDKRREQIKTVTFNYGQKHQIEIESARKICKLAQVDFDLVEIPSILRSTSPLVDNSQALDQYQSISEFQPGVQTTFVPGRNILFLTIAANLAMHHGIANIVIGVCQEDFGGYYDCREKYIQAMELALNQGLLGKDSGIRVHTPLMHLNKSEIVKLAHGLGPECMQALAHTHTCYAGVYPPCGKCHACLLRERGFKEAGIVDPLLKHPSQLS